jgi:hypothetical protein
LGWAAAIASRRLLALTGNRLRTDQDGQIANDIIPTIEQVCTIGLGSLMLEEIAGSGRYPLRPDSSSRIRPARFFIRPSASGRPLFGALIQQTIRFDPSLPSSGRVAFDLFHFPKPSTLAIKN